MFASRPIRAGGRSVGFGQPCFIAAEIGINHNGDLELAKSMVEAAAKCGADAVKFQNYRTEDFVSDRTLTYTYTSQGRTVTEPQWDMFKRCEMKVGWIPELKTLCDSLGVIFFSTPMSLEGVEDLVGAGVLLLKNGSDCLTHIPLLESMGATGLPVVVSTGMADASDVNAAVAAVRRGGKSELILLHCTSAYPTAPEDTNLRRMVSLAERYGLPTGFSDHTEGWVAAVQAVTLGACFLEKHFTTDRNLPGPDQRFSSSPEEFAELVREVRKAEARLGSAKIGPAEAERLGREQYRLSAVAKRDLSAGDVLRADDIAFRRPGTGISPAETARYIGLPLQRSVRAGTQINRADIGEAEQSRD